MAVFHQHIGQNGSGVFKPWIVVIISLEEPDLLPLHVGRLDGREDAELSPCRVALFYVAFRRQQLLRLGQVGERTPLRLGPRGGPYATACHANAVCQLAAGGCRAGDKEGGLLAEAAPPTSEERRAGLQLAALAIPRHAGGFWSFPVSFRVHRGMLFQQALLPLFALQQDVVAARPCGERVLKDAAGGEVLRRAFMPKNQFMFFGSQESFFGELPLRPVKFLCIMQRKETLQKKQTV